MVIKQIIFLRIDLNTFSKGALAAQAIHASIKAIQKNANDSETIEYLQNIDHMTTIILKIKEADISIIKNYLHENKYMFEPWIEQPENLITAIALKPYIIEEKLEKFLRTYKLY
ncbi:peptidyl-tRNA hydrolase domain-containing protein 1 [Gurleya vavrai]